MATASPPPHLAGVLTPEPTYAVFFWPLVGIAGGALCTLWLGQRGPLLGLANLVAGLLGAAAGGLVTLAFTAGQPESGGFFTSLVTSAIGTVVALGLWRAILEWVREP